MDDDVLSINDIIYEPVFPDLESPCIILSVL